MRLLPFVGKTPCPQKLTTGRLALRPPVPDDFRNWSALRETSRDFLQPWEPEWTKDELSRSAWRRRLRQVEADHRSGRGLHFLILLREANALELIGSIAVTNIRRNIADTGTLGYWIGEPFARQGFMGEALTALCDHCFQMRDITRLEAATVTDNTASQRLLKSCDFVKEGEASAYLKIDGEWRDHLLFSRTAKTRLRAAR